MCIRDRYESHIEEETLNSMIPIWKKNKKDLKQEEYNLSLIHIFPPKTFDWWGGSTKGVSSNTFCYGDEAALPFHRHAA